MDNETKEILNLILSKINTIETKVDTLETKMNTMETKMDTMQTKINTIETKVDTMQSDITEIKADVKANYQELLTLDKRTLEIQNRISNLKTVTAQNCYDITLLKEKQA